MAYRFTPRIASGDHRFAISFGFDEIATGTLDAALLPLESDLEGRVIRPAVGTLDAALLPLDADLSGRIIRPATGALDAELLPLEADLSGVVVEIVPPGTLLALDNVILRVREMSPLARPAPQAVRTFGGRIRTTLTVAAPLAVAPGAVERERGWRVTCGYYDHEEAAQISDLLNAPGAKIGQGVYLGDGLTDVFTGDVSRQVSEIMGLVEVSFSMWRRYR